MIEELDSDLPGFKHLTFAPGLNILLAERAPDSTDRDTRNGAGKSSFVELVHFLLAANADPDSIFRGAALGEASFTMRLTVPEATGDPRPHHGLTITRSGARPARAEIVLHEAAEDSASDVSIAELRDLLGGLLFAIPADAGPHSPTARALLGYFARRIGSNGFNEAFKNNAQQQLVDTQVCVSYLLGLDWTIPRDLDGVRQREKQLKELRRAARAGVLGIARTNLAELRTRIVLAEEHLGQVRADLDGFRVVEQYEDLQRRADRLTRALRDASDAAALSRRYEGELHEALSHEVPPALDDLKRVYEEAGVVLPDAVVTRFDDVRAFHESVIANRRDYLEAEAARAASEAAAHLADVDALDRQRAQVMDVLHSGGALESFRKLQDDLSREEEEVAALRRGYEAGRELESGVDDARRERQVLLGRLRLDHQEHEAAIDEAIRTFRGLSDELYDGLGGQFVVGATENGPNFDVRIAGERSRGITSMQIFCVDLTFARLSTRLGRSPGFLIHDSHVFDGVDSRQVFNALQLAAHSADEYGYQHIITLNSDALPTATDAFDPALHVLKTVLTDKHETGGLFGLRFA